MNGKDAVPQQRVELSLLRAVSRRIADRKGIGILFRHADLTGDPVNTDSVNLLRLIDGAAGSVIGGIFVSAVVNGVIKGQLFAGVDVNAAASAEYDKQSSEQNGE